jgi:NCS1 family nucleobase:cation symporter-1
LVYPLDYCVKTAVDKRKIGGFSTLAVNVSDFSRFSKKPGSPVWQLPMISIFKVITGLFGIIAASASQKVYDTILWSPLDIIDQWKGSSGSRVAAFFCASLWLLAQICNNISANSVSFANGTLNQYLQAVKKNH